MECVDGLSSREAFSAFYDANAKRVYDFIYHKTFHRETARDLTHTVFLKAMERLDDLKPEETSFPAWIFTVARNSVIDYYRTRHPSVSVEDVWDLKSDQDVELDVLNRERYEILHRHLHALSPEKRELLVLRIWEDLSFAEIALIQGVTPGSCKMAFHRLIKQLREEMPALLMMLICLKP